MACGDDTAADGDGTGDDSVGTTVATSSPTTTTAGSNAASGVDGSSGTSDGPPADPFCGLLPEYDVVDGEIVWSLSTDQGSNAPAFCLAAAEIAMAVIPPTGPLEVGTTVVEEIGYVRLTLAGAITSVVALQTSRAWSAALALAPDGRLAVTGSFDDSLTLGPLSADLMHDTQAAAVVTTAADTPTWLGPVLGAPDSLVSSARHAVFDVATGVVDDRNLVGLRPDGGFAIVTLADEGELAKLVFLAADGALQAQHDTAWPPGFVVMAAGAVTGGAVVTVGVDARPS